MVWIFSPMPVPGNLPVQLQQGEYTLGRSSRCEIILASLSVSRRHAKLSWLSDSSAILEDLGSTNGVFVGDDKVAQCILTCPSRFRVGRIDLFLVTTNPAAAAVEDLETEKAAPGHDGASELAAPIALLTPAQRQVLIHLLNGLDEKQIATRLDRSEHTIHNHIRDLYAALEVHSRSQLWRKLFRGQ